MKYQLLKFCFIVLIFFRIEHSLQAQTTKLIEPGAVIINMGVVPQTVGNGLKPYGLVYNLLETQKVPVIWSIKSNKLKDSADFTVDGIQFKGGPFIIEKEYVALPNVQAAITAFMAQGVVRYITLTPVTVPVYRELKVFPKWTLDDQNDGLVRPYLVNAGIPSGSFPVKAPRDLGVCDDIYLLPHADPTWAQHRNLFFWNKPVSQGGNFGWIWSGCHAVSVFENIVNPGNPAQRMNFLAVNPPAQPLVPFGSHQDPSNNSYKYAYPGDFVMQCMGIMDDAFQNGSEQVYLPSLTGAWRPTTKVAVWDSLHPQIPGLSPGKAALIAYGYGFGDTANGMVMYEAGHSLNNNGNNSQDVAAQRAMLNFSFDAPVKKAPTFSPVLPIPTSIKSGQTVNLNILGFNFKGQPVVSYAWTASCAGGSFSSTTTPATTYTAPVLGINVNDQNCYLTLTITDSCGRRNFLNIRLTNSSPKTRPDILVVLPNVLYSGSVKTNDDVRTGTTYGAPTALAGNPSACMPSMNANGTYTFICSTPGEYNFAVPVCPPGVFVNCPTELLTITVVDPNSVTQPPTANPDIIRIIKNTSGTINVRANDVCNNGPTCTLSNPTIITQPKFGTASVNGSGNVVVNPNTGYIGRDSLRYRVCDNQTPSPKCDTEFVIILVIDVDQPNSTVSNDDYVYTKGTTPATGNILNNDIDPEGNTQTATAQNIVLPSGTFVLNTNGTYTFTAVAGFKGTVAIPTTVCDNGSPTACDTSTLYILVKPADFATDPDFLVTTINTASSGNVKSNDNVPTGTTYGTPIAQAGNPSGCMPVMNANGTYTFICATPGEYNYSVPICPPWLAVGCPTELLTITVLDPRINTLPPVANPDELKTLQGNAGTVNVRANDACNNGPTCTLSNPTIISQPKNGTAVVNGNGTITVTPNGGFVGEDTLMYSVCDNQTPTPKCDTEFVFITVYPTGYPNTTVANGDYNSTTGRTPATGNVLDNDLDPEGNTQTVTAQNIVNANGTFVLNTNGTYTFTAAGGITGPITYVYTVCDNGTPVACDTANLQILVKPETYDTDPDFLVTNINTASNGNVKTNDNVPAGSTYGTPIAQPGNPSACAPVMNANGTYTFICATPGEYNYSVLVCPPWLAVGCPTELLTITVLDPRINTLPPVANPDELKTLQGTAGTVNVKANDACNNGPTCTLSNPTIISQPKNGTAVVNGNGTITVTPNVSFVGEDTLLYSVCDNQTPTPKCDTEFVFVTVYPTGYPNSTVANDDFGVSRYKKVVTGNVLDNDMDPEGNTLTVTPQNIVNANGIFVLGANGAFTFTPAQSYSGPIDFVYTVCDNGSPVACDTATLHILVTVPSCIVSNKNLIHRLR